MDKIVKNPMLISVLAGVSTYAYLSWKKKEEIRKNRKNKKKLRKISPHVDIVIPAIVAILAWFIAFGYFNYHEDVVVDNNAKLLPMNNTQVPLPPIAQQAVIPKEPLTQVVAQQGGQMGSQLGGAIGNVEIPELLLDPF